MKSRPEPLVFIIDWNACIRCGACVAVCPLVAGFISAFDTISITDPCGVACLACEKVCPVSAITHRRASAAELSTKTVFQAIHRSPSVSSAKLRSKNDRSEHS